MKAESIESDIPGTVQLEQRLPHSRVSTLRPSSVHLLVSFLQDSACCQNTVADAACLIPGFDS